MNRNILLISAAVALGLFCSGCKKNTVVKTTTTLPAGPVQLKLKWPAGRHIVQSMNIKQTSEIAVPGMPAPMKQDMDMGQKYALGVLKENADGGHDVELEILGMRMFMKMQERNVVDFDSTRKSDAAATEPTAVLFGKIAGTKFRFVLDASNRVERVEGFEALQAKLAGGADNEASTMFKSIFNEQYFKQIMDHSQNLPAKPVQPGDTWPVKMEITMGEMGTMIMDYTYTFQNWEKRNDRYCARISVDGTVNSKPGQAPKASGMTMSVENGKSAGETWFDLDAGMYVETAIVQDMKALITLPASSMRGNAQAGKPQTISSLMKQNVTIKVESLN